MKEEKTYAYSEALALESVENLGTYDEGENVHNNVTSKELEHYARIVAYKVADNLKNGFEMDEKIDPLTYIECN